MGLGKTYSTDYLVDSNGNTGVAGQILVTTATGVSWQDAKNTGDNQTQGSLFDSKIVLIDTPNGGLKTYRVITDEYGEWIQVGRFAANAMTTIQGTWSSVSGLSTGIAQSETTQFSADFGDSFPTEVRVVGATDFNNWRNTRTIDWIYKSPEGRKWKYFFSGGAENGMTQVPLVGGTSNRWGWTVNGAYDGFGRWTNAVLANIGMSDANVTNPSAAYSTATSNAFNWDAANDAKLTVNAYTTYSGQDQGTTSGVGSDDATNYFFDSYPTQTSNGVPGGTEFSSAVWVLIKLPGGASGSGGGGGGYWAANGLDIYNTNADYVGIGTSVPGDKLNVEGNILLGTTDKIGWRYSSGNTSYNFITGEDQILTLSGGTWTSSGTQTAVRIKTQQGEKLTIRNNGDVGIGTTSPDAKFEVAGGTSGIRLSNVGDSGAYDSIEMTYNGYNSGTPEMKFRPTQTPGSGIVNSYFRFINSNGSNATANNYANVSIDGSLGIGTQAPASQLHVVANDSTVAQFSSIGTLANDKTLQIQSGGDRIIFDVKNHTNGNAAGLAFEVGGAEKVRLTTSGNFGINTTQAGGPLQVSGQENGVSQNTAILGSTLSPGGGGGSAATSPVNKTLLTGYGIPYSGNSNARLTNCGFLQFDSTPGWTGSQRDWAITSGYDIGGNAGGTSGNKLAILVGNAQNVNPELGTNGAVGTGDGSSTLVATYWNNTLDMIVPSGKVGIGTTSPSSTLEVSGRISGGELGNPKITRDDLNFYVDFNDKSCVSGQNVIEVPIDLGPNNYDLTLSGGANFEYLGGIGTFYFDGNADHISINNFDNLSSTSNTYEVWHYANSQNGWETMWDSGNERPLLGTYDDDLRAYPNATVFGTVDTGKWYHFVWAFASDSDLDVYINGVRVAEAVNWGSSQRLGVFQAWLGGDGSAETTDGYISIARAYRKQLTPADVLQNYNAEVGMFATQTPSLGIVQAGGNVGIGTDNPVYKLDVEGDIRAKENIRVFGNSVSPPTYNAPTETSVNLGTYINDYAYIDLASTNAGGSWLDFSKGDGSDYGGRIRYVNSSDQFQIYTAASQKMVIKSGGDVGIGTTAPAAKLHVKEPSGSTSQIKMSASSNEANYGYLTMTDNTVNTAKLTFGTTYGYNAPVPAMTVWNGMVGIGTTSPSEALNIGNNGQLRFDGNASGKGIVASSNGSNQTFSITRQDGVNVGDLSISAYSGIGLTGNRTSSPATSAYALYVKSTGNVGIGEVDPLVKLHVNQGNTSGTVIKASGIGAQIEILTTTAGDAHLYMRPNTTGNNAAVFKMTAGTNYNWRWQDDATTPVVFMQLSQSNSSLSVKGDIIAYGSPSDERYKENIKPIESALDKVTKLQGVTFDWKESDSLLDIKEDIGFIAQDVQKVVPELVRENEDGKLSLRYQGVTPILLEAIKELKAEIDLLKSKPCNCNNCNCSI